MSLIQEAANRRQRVTSQGRLSLVTRLRFSVINLLLIACCCGILTSVIAVRALARPWAAEIDVGGQFDGPYLDGFYGFERNDEGRFRWSQPTAEISLPGAGSLAPLGLRMHGGTSGKQVRLSDGSSTFTLELRPGWQHISLLPRADTWSGDVRLTLATAPQTDPDRRELGVVLDQISLRGRGNAPPLGQAGLLGLSAALVTVLVGWSMRRISIGLLAGVAIAIGAGAVLTQAGGTWRLWFTQDTGRLALALLLSGALAWTCERLLAALERRGTVRLGASARRTLAAAAMLAFLLRFASMSYPLNFTSDLRFYVGRAWLVRSGKFGELFWPNPDLTPVQWQTDISVPRTPFYYLLATPFTFLPGTGPDLGVMAFSSATDALAALLVGMLALRAGGGGRGALAAALLVAVLPFSLIVTTSWGIFATTLGQAMALLWAVLWLHLRPKLHERRAQLLLAAPMTFAFLSHPATLILLGGTWAALLIFLLIRRDRAARPTLWSGLIAGLVALLLYYGWQLPELIARSLPTVFGALGGGKALTTETRAHDAVSIAAALWPKLREMYGSPVLWLAGIGALLLFSKLLDTIPVRSANSPFRTERKYVALLLLAWCMVYPPLALADARVTLNYKHVLYMLPVVAVLAGLLLGRIARYRWGVAVTTAMLALVLWQGMSLVVYKVMYAYVGLR